MTLSLTFLIVSSSTVVLLLLALLFNLRKLKNQLKKKQIVIDKNEQEVEKFKTKYEKRIQEIDLEIRARDKKITLLKNELEKWQLAHEEIERTLQLELSHKKAIQTEFKAIQETLQEKVADNQAVIEEKNLQLTQLKTETDKKIQTLVAENKLQNAEISRIKVALEDLEVKLKKHQA